MGQIFSKVIRSQYVHNRVGIILVIIFPYLHKLNRGNVTDMYEAAVICSMMTVPPSSTTEAPGGSNINRFMICNQWCCRPCHQQGLDLGYILVTAYYKQQLPDSKDNDIYQVQTEISF